MSASKSKTGSIGHCLLALALRASTNVFAPAPLHLLLCFYAGLFYNKVAMMIGLKVTRFFLSAVLLAVAMSSNTAIAAQPSANVRAVVEKAIARLRPSLVRIQVVSTDYRDGRELKMQAVGSGAIITKEGHIITNHHVAGHAVRIICTLWDREEIEAELVGTDPLTDIAVIKLKPERPREFVPATFGDSSKMQVGDSVLAMGSPMALSQSVTLGIISNKEMTMPRLFGSAGRFRLEGEDVGSLVRWLGHDAAIYGGNSGGPLVNLAGQIIGINEIRFGLSGAIPGNLARRIADQLIAHGKVRRSWLGLDVQPQFKHLDEQAARGVLISGVIADSPASRAGLQPGDLMIKLNGKQTNARYEEELPDFMRLVTSLPIGQEVPAQILRAGKRLTVRLTPVERGELNTTEHELRQWGLTVCDLSFLRSREMKRTSQNGVLVTSVRPGGPSGDAKPPLANDDVITEVNGQPVNNVKALQALTETISHGKTDPTPAMVVFERDRRRYLTVVNVGVQELRDPGLEVSKAWVPIETHVISREIARQLGKPALRGVYITEVYPNTAARKAGLRPGDFITAVDDQKLTASGPQDEDDFAALIRQYDIGAKVQLTVLRGQETLKIPVELARSPKLRREMKKYRNDDFGFTARNIAFFDIAQEQWSPGQRGVLVEDVKSGSWAELGSLYIEDLLVEVDGQPVNDVESLRTIMGEIATSKKPFVIMKVRRGIHTAFLELEPVWKN